MSEPWNLQRARREAAKIMGEAKLGVEDCSKPMRGILLKLIEKADPAENAGGSNYITYMLPVWIGEHAGVPAARCRELAVGSVYMMLHYFLLDDVMDEEDMQLGPKEALAAAQVLHALFMERYSLNDGEKASLLWSGYRKYVEEWAHAAAQEGLQRADPLDVASLARKSAPLKIGAAAIWLECGRMEMIAPAEQAAELALASLQLADDWADWREDLAAGEERCNAFLTLVRGLLEWPEKQALDERSVRRAVYQEGILERLSDLLRSHRQWMSKLPDAAPGLLWFQQEVLSGIEADAESARRTVLQLAADGGFSHYLSKNTKL